MRKVKPKIETVVAYTLVSEDGTHEEMGAINWGLMLTNIQEVAATRPQTLVTEVFELVPKGDHDWHNSKRWLPRGKCVNVVNLLDALKHVPGTMPPILYMLDLTGSKQAAPLAKVWIATDNGDSVQVDWDERNMFCFAHHEHRLSKRKAVCTVALHDGRIIAAMFTSELKSSLRVLAGSFSQACWAALTSEVVDGNMATRLQVKMAKRVWRENPRLEEALRNANGEAAYSFGSSYLNTEFAGFVRNEGGRIMKNKHCLVIICSDQL